MKKFLEKNFLIIVTVIMLIVMVGNCAQNREITKIKNEITSIKDSTYTKSDYNEITLLLEEHRSKVSEREGLRSELRFYQATDRRLLDVNRQSVVEQQIKELDEQIKQIERKIYETLDK